MYIYGLHIIDLIVIIFYLAGMFFIGKVASKKIHGQEDFFLSGRKLGKLYQFFLNFGELTDANGAAVTSGIVYSKGVGGVWIAMQSLFMTPFYWFINKWFRRVRLVTMGDLFTDRFGGKSLSVSYATFSLFVSLLGTSFGLYVSCKTMEAMLVKPEAQYSIEEKQMISQYAEYTNLRTLYEADRLPDDMVEKYTVLNSLYKAGKLPSYISYINPLMFFIIYCGIIGCYTVMGGFSAAVLADAFQAVLIIVFSLILIPFGLFKLGGLNALHSSVPEYMFRLFGDGAKSEYTWYSTLAFLVVGLIHVFGKTHQMATSGSARNELSAQIGIVTGAFGKRFMMICWCLCGLIGFGLFQEGISNPDMIWGTLTKTLLVAPGLVGLMLAGILSANMSTLSAHIICLSALFIRNLYMPLFLKKSEKHYLFMSRLLIVIFLLLSVLIAMKITGIMHMVQFLIIVNVIFGAPVLLMFLWRRLTKIAVWVQIVACFIVIIILPWIVPAVPKFSQSKELTLQTYEIKGKTEVRATEIDVRMGLASAINEKIIKDYKIEPKSCFFEKVIHVDPSNPDSVLKGEGCFYSELYILSKLGINLRNMTPAMLLTIRLLFDALFPFLILFVVSYLTKPTDKRLVDRFYVKMKTKIQPTQELDHIEIESSFKNPNRFDHLKLFPNSNWEFLRWEKVDTKGFLLCWIAVGVILGIFWLVLNIGK